MSKSGNTYINPNSGLYITAYKPYYPTQNISADTRASKTYYYSYNSRNIVQNYQYYVTEGCMNEKYYTYYLPDNYKVNVNAIGTYCP